MRIFLFVANHIRFRIHVTRSYEVSASFRTLSPASRNSPNKMSLFSDKIELRKMRLNLNASDRRVFSSLELSDTEDRRELTKVKEEKTERTRRGNRENCSFSRRSSTM